MNNAIRCTLLAAILAGGAASFGIGSRTVLAAPAQRATHASALLGWLQKVASVENILVVVGNDLAKVGTTSKTSQALADVRAAESQNQKAIKLYRSAPTPPSKYTAMNKILARSLAEYQDGLKVVDRGFVKKSTKVVTQGLAIVKKGTKDQNTFAALLKKASKK